LAYISNAAIFDFGGMSFSGGVIAMYLWRSIYFAESVSFRTRCMLAMDWGKRAFFGRGMFLLPLSPGAAHVSFDLTNDSFIRSHELLNLTFHIVHLPMDVMGFLLYFISLCFFSHIELEALKRLSISFFPVSLPFIPFSLA
jgi:hypothetical protein